MASQRAHIDADVVKQALAQAKDGFDGIFDYVDISLSYFALRTRRHTATWLVKTRDLTRKIGAPPKMLVREARDIAQTTFARLRTEPGPEADDKVADLGWTWEQLRSGYQEHVESPRVKNGRARYPSEATAYDVDLSLGREAFETWRTRRIATLTPSDLVTAVKEVQRVHSHRQCEKALSYAKAAFTWALSNKITECGLDQKSPWWMTVQAPVRSPDEVTMMLERQKGEKKKEPFTVEHLGKLLARHEDFCRGKLGNERISPGVRWGLWWDALTVNRRGAATMLLRDDIQWEDPRGLSGWGLVWWPAELMKARIDFWLPVPPLGLHILTSAIRDWRELVNKSHGHGNTTKWAFASTRRIGRLNDNLDVVLAPDALSNHLRNMRGERDHNHRNLLKDLPPFSMHSIRDACASFLLDRSDLPPGAASAMLAHTIKGDVDPKDEKASPTTRRFYDFGQRIPLKTIAMKAWSEELLKSFKAAGGIYPQ